MDAIELLKTQHRLVERLFEQFDEAEEDEDKKAIFDEVADALAVHTAIEERIFYPAVRARQTEQQLEQAFDEHLEAKQLLLEALRNPEAVVFADKVAALEDVLSHHVDEEEHELFPEVRKLLATDALEALGKMMEAEAARMMDAGSPRDTIQPKVEPAEIHV